MSAKPKKKTAPVAPVPQIVPQSVVEPRRKLWQALFFTKDGRLDLGWLILAICAGVGLSVFVGQALKAVSPDTPSKEAWMWFTAFTTLAFIGGAARDRAALMQKATVVGALSQMGGAVYDNKTEVGGE